MRSTTASSSSSSSSSSGISASADDMPAALPTSLPDDKHYSRLLSKWALSSSSTATAAAAPSFRVYYSLAPGSVPFHWEASPGTPKHPATGDHYPSCTAPAVPPLTPPPSYLTSPRTPLGSSATRKQHRYSKAAGLLASILPRSSSGSRWNRMLASHSAASLSQSASSFSSSSSSTYESPRRAASVYHHDEDDDEGGIRGAPVTLPKSSAFCFQVPAARPYCCKASGGPRC